MRVAPRHLLELAGILQLCRAEALGYAWTLHQRSLLCVRCPTCLRRSAACAVSPRLREGILLQQPLLSRHEPLSLSRASAEYQL